MKKDELKKIFDQEIPSTEEMEKWGKEIIVKGETINTVFSIIEFIATIIGAVPYLIPNNSLNKKRGGKS